MTKQSTITQKHKLFIADRLGYQTFGLKIVWIQTKSNNITIYFT